jgi:hypothetical protein|tara:strand:- start:465 stop:1004 length:540 start_codon:yes stop_codon:yes gene_type:complete
MDKRQTVGDFWEIIKYNYDQIRYAEIKSSVVISVYSLFFTGAYTIDVIDDENVYSLSFVTIWDYLSLLFLLPGLYFTLISFSSCIRCFLPRLKQSALKSPLFFGDIAMDNKDFAEFLPKFKSLREDSEEYKKHLTHMIYVTGNIAFTKFLHVNTAIKSLIKSIGLFVFYILSLYLTQLF